MPVIGYMWIRNTFHCNQTGYFWLCFDPELHSIVTPSSPVFFTNHAYNSS
jgi:hypothetical protein